MTLDHLISFCEALPGSTAKSFLWLGQDEVPITCAFKCSDEDFAILPERDGFMPAPYMARNKWIMCTDIGLLEVADLERYIRKSYLLMRDKLSKKALEKLVSNGGSTAI
jgi:predicted DNA-binding protein (MmcQ/YjbR family)